MKNLVKIFGIVTLVVTIGFGIAACDDDDGDSGVSGKDTLSYSDDVYKIKEPDMEKISEDIMGGNSFTIKAETEKFTGSATFDAYNPDFVTGSVSGGKLTLAIGTPAATDLESAASFKQSMGYFYANPTVSDETAKFATFQGIRLTNGGLSKGTVSGSYSFGKKSTMTNEQVVFLYVDKDVKITAEGKDSNDGDMAVKSKNFSVDLKKGWNSVVQKSVTTIGAFDTNSDDSDSDSDMSQEISLSKGDKGRWIYEEWNNEWD